MGLTLLVVVSYAADRLFSSGKIPAKYDVFEQIVRKRVTSRGAEAIAAKHISLTASHNAEYALASKDEKEKPSEEDSKGYTGVSSFYSADTPIQL